MTRAHPPAAGRSVPSSTSHGGDGPAVAAALGLDPTAVLDLSASLNPFAPDVPAMARRHLASLVAYPDDRAATEAMADELGIDAGRLVLTNGGSEAIALVAAHVGVGAVVEPEFSLYRRHLPSVDPTAGRWRSNPSNPLGQLAADEETAAVWDEAFYSLATGTWTRGDDHAWRLGSLTKLWACAGLRIGYAIAPSVEDADAIRRSAPLGSQRACPRSPARVAERDRPRRLGWRDRRPPRRLCCRGHVARAFRHRERSELGAARGRRRFPLPS